MRVKRTGPTDHQQSAPILTAELGEQLLLGGREVGWLEVRENHDTVSGHLFHVGGKTPHQFAAFLDALKETRSVGRTTETRERNRWISPAGPAE